MSDTLDKIDRLLLCFVQENANRTANQLSQKLAQHKERLGPAAARNRVDDLTNRGFIKATRAILDPDKIGLSTMCFMLVKLGEKNGESETKFKDKAHGIRNVLEIHETTGQYDYIIKAHVHAIKDALAISQQLKPMVGSIETLLVGDTHKNDTALPLDES